MQHIESVWGQKSIGPEDEAGTIYPPAQRPQEAKVDSVAVQKTITYDGRIVVQSTEPYDQAYKNIDTLGLPHYDLSGCVEIDLGPDVYGLLDFDGGHYRVGLYFSSAAGEPDEGGVCAIFDDFASCEAFITRLRNVHAPTGIDR